MRLLLVILGAATLAAIGFICWRATGERREWRELLALAAKSTLTDAEKRVFADLAHRRIPEADPTREPWKLLVMNRQIVAFFLKPGRASDIELHFLNQDRRHLWSTTFRAGIHACGLEFKETVKPELGPWTFQIESRGPASGIVHHYSVWPGHLFLVRAEDGTGELQRNNYAVRSEVVGPSLPDDGPERCAAALNSADIPSILEALVWLAGRHPETSAWQEARRQPEIVRLVSDLSRSPHPWIAQAAAQVEKINGPQAEARR